MIQELEAQGVPRDAIIGFDEAGVPKLCGTGVPVSSSPSPTSSVFAQGAAALPPGMQSWEAVPGVILNDGIDGFRLEVDVNGPVNGVELELQDLYLISDSGSNTLVLRDDGLGEDQVAGDYIYTSELIRYKVSEPMPDYQSILTTNSPRGVRMAELGFVDIIETGGAKTDFLISPKIGFLNTNVARIKPVMLSGDIQASDHFINILTTNREGQIALRTSTRPTSMAARIYQVVPDAFEFLSFFTTDHVEWENETATDNFTAGRHWVIQVDYTGTGQAPRDLSGLYGSEGRLLGANAFDNLTRGIFSSYTPAHEYLHQWACWVYTPGLRGSGAHYHSLCGLHSLLGGWQPVYTNGYIVRGCSGSGPSEATQIDKYFAGVLSANEVLPIPTSGYNPSCNYPVVTNGAISIDDVTSVYGVRSPGPADSRKHFSIGFVAGSHKRLLNSTEMTFYEILAEWFTRTLPPGTPNPKLDLGWVPITRFFGDGVTWSSEVLPLFQPDITGFTLVSNDTVEVTCTGYPGWDYDLLRTTNLIDWQVVTNATASTNSVIAFIDEPGSVPAASFYRVALP